MMRRDAVVQYFMQQQDRRYLESNLQKIWSLCNITLLFWFASIWQILLQKEKISMLAPKHKVADEKKLVFHQPLGFQKAAHWTLSSPKKMVKWKQVKITNIILQRPKILCRFAWDSSQAIFGSNSSFYCSFELKAMIKFMLSKKVTKINEMNLHHRFDIVSSSKCQINGEDFVNFSGLLRKHEL